ncbi:MAG: type IV toxin-antitoxin system AbiEi family antitoxin domain-containing protein [Actinomycetota bacterium]
MRDVSDLVQQATSQHGLLTTAQFREHGVTSSTQSRLVESGILLPVRRGVVRLAGAPATWHQQVLAAILASRVPTVASHRAALRLWGLRTRYEGVELCVRRPANPRLQGAVVHRSVDLEAGDVTLIDGIPTTNPARTLCDAGVVFPPHEVLRLTEHAVAVGLVGKGLLVEIRRRVGEHGRTGVGRLQAALDEMVPGIGCAESGPEAALRRLLRGSGLPDPTPQHEVVVRDRTYRLDLAYPKARVAIEYDGIDVHTRVDRFVEDRRRQNDLVAAGWSVVRVTSADMRERSANLVAQIRTLLHRDLG